jgi:23S rRNA (uracil1939-C5)-methyltransferase
LHYIASVRKGDRLRLLLTGLDGDAAGVAEHEGRAVHVAGALDGEEVDATLQHLSPHRPEAWAQLESVVRPSAARVSPACPAYGQCGGCPLEHMRYDAQLAWKRDELARALAHFPSLAIGACVPSPRPLGYRNKSKLVYARDADGRPVLGAFAPRSHRVVDLAGCRVAEAPLDDVAAALLQACARFDVAPFDERAGTGVLRYAILRVNHAARVLVTLVTATREFSDGRTLGEALMRARPDVAGVVQNVNETRGNALFGRQDFLLAGESALEELVGGVRLTLSATAFFQVNRDVAAAIYRDLATAAALTGGERVVDAYCGVGGIALTLAPRARHVVGVEEHAGAVADAAAAADANGAGNARFVAGDAAAVMATLDGADVVVLNPPRRGCAPEVLAQAARLGPRMIAYVSCAPDTLARDLALLEGLGYRARTATPYDMLPQTPHVETLAILTPA